jgi:hypothetical protein
MQKKMKHQAEPDEQSRKDVTVTVVYEEIDELLQVPKPINTCENIAYGQLHHAPHSAV